jgi:methyl-accepting chemotaxis protein
MSISQRLYLILGIMILLMSAELTALWFTVSTLSAVRAYVGAEGLWSKAQKDAIYQLEVYGRTGNEKYYRNYQAFLRVPLGDRQTRLEMAKPNPDYIKELQGFTLVLNHPNDMPGMISLFQRFHQVGYISQALADWEKGDTLLLRIGTLGARLHDEVRTGQAKSVVDRTLDEISQINQTLTQVEDHFSYTLGQGSRWLTSLVLTILVSAAVTVELTGLYLTSSITRDVSKRLNSMLEVADRISKGDYRASLDTSSNDEIGRLSRAMNSMTGDIGREQARAENAVRATDAALREAQRVAHIGSWE